MKLLGIRAFSYICVASVGSLLLGMGCKTPPPVGNNPAVSPPVEGSGGTPSTPTGSDGMGGSLETFMLPEASVIATGGILTVDAALATGDANCGSTQSELKKKPVDLLLVLDRSTSMNQAMDTGTSCPANSTTCSQRWSTIRASLDTVFAKSPPEVHWGLKFFSSPTTTGAGGRGGASTQSCVVNPGVEVAVGAGNAPKIQTEISTVGNASSTPTRLAVDAAVAYLKTVDDDYAKFILLATDGEPNCAANGGGTNTSDLPGTIEAVKNAAEAGYKVFVLGVGPEAANLTELAQAGGTEKFYSATSPQAMTDALSSIVGVVAAGCTYDLPSKPIAPDAVGVYIDKARIPQDNGDGWSYKDGGNTTITINGSYCEALKSGEKKLVEIFLPCKPTDVIPQAIL